MYSLQEFLLQELKEGNIVQTGAIGSFYPVVTIAKEKTKGAKNTINNFEFGINYRPTADMKKEIEGAELERIMASSGAIGPVKSFNSSTFLLSLIMSELIIPTISSLILRPLSLPREKSKSNPPGDTFSKILGNKYFCFKRSMVEQKKICLYLMILNIWINTYTNEQVMSFRRMVLIFVY